MSLQYWQCWGCCRLRHVVHSWLLGYSSSCSWGLLPHLMFLAAVTFWHPRITHTAVLKASFHSTDDFTIHSNCSSLSEIYNQNYKFSTHDCPSSLPNFVKFGALGCRDKWPKICNFVEVRCEHSLVKWWRVNIRWFIQNQK